MNILLDILLVLAGLIALLLLVALFIPKKYSIEHEINIQRPLQHVFDYVRYLKNQDNFSVWAKMDPDMKKEFRGIDGNIGFISAWESNNKNVGKGEQEITGITENKRVDFDIRFIKPFEANAKAYLKTVSSSESSTSVKWGFASEMKYPMNLMLLFMNVEKMVGKDLSSGLANLKGELERNS